MMNIEEHHINQLLNKLHEDTGIEITHANRWQVQHRIRALCRTLSYSVQELRRRITTSERHVLYPKLIDCIVVQESFFFRDDHFYDQLKHDVIPKLIEKFHNIKIWSAACAEGQEPYSLSILLHQMDSRHNIQIFGSDISSAALQGAKNGCYLHSSLSRNLSQKDIQLYFQPVTNETPQKRYQIKQQYKKNLIFFEHNLMHPTGKHRFYHLIILRNALMYFSESHRKICIDNLRRSVQKGGVLIISNPNTQIIQC